MHLPWMPNVSGVEVNGDSILRQRQSERTCEAKGLSLPQVFSLEELQTARHLLLRYRQSHINRRVTFRNISTMDTTLYNNKGYFVEMDISEGRRRLLSRYLHTRASHSHELAHFFLCHRVSNFCSSIFHFVRNVAAVLHVH